MSAVASPTGDNVSAVVNAIESLSPADVRALSDALYEKFNVSKPWTPPEDWVPPTKSGPDEVVEEQTEFNVKLASVPPADKKLGVIRILREITGLALKEAKAIADDALMIKENVSKEEAEKIKTQITEAGGVVEIK